MPDGIRELLEQERNGVLATVSASRAGWPFASVAPYALTPCGQPLLLLSRLAEHTRNVVADPRASLLVQDRASLDDPQAGARVTLLGVLERVGANELDSASRRYVDRHPAAAAYFALGDFHLYVLDVSEARYISGFGDMGWIAGERLLADFARP